MSWQRRVMGAPAARKIADSHRMTADSDTVEFANGDRGRGFLHVDQGERVHLAQVAVRSDNDGMNDAIWLEQGPHVLFGRIERQFVDVDRSHRSSPRSLWLEMGAWRAETNAVWQEGRSHGRAG